MLRNLCFVLTFAAFVPASAATIPVVDDGHIQFSGTNGLSTVTDSVGIRTLRSGGSNVRHGLFEFDLSMLSLSNEAEIESATIQFELVAQISNTSNTAEVGFYGYASDGQIEDSDFDSPAPSTSNLMRTEIFPARAGNSPASGSTLTVALDNFQPLQDAITAGDQFFTVRSETVNFVSFQVGALEHATATPATLDVRIVPLLGDFDHNGVVDIRDIDELTYGDATYDLDDNGVANESDLDVLVTDLIGTWYGDSTGDGQFSTEDFVAIFKAGKFETGQPATWAEGDWDHDGVFTTQDFIKAFKDGGFEAGNRPVMAAAVPEPSTLIGTCLGLFGLANLIRRKR